MHGLQEGRAGVARKVRREERDMTKARGVGRLAITAGLGLALVTGPYAVAFAEPGSADTPVEGEYANPSYTRQVSGESNGDTKLYVIGTQDSLTTSDAAVDENIKVSIPVAIHYVADSEGNLTGPSDNMVKFVNHTKLGSVHVSGIAVENAGDVRIAPDADNLQDDQMSFFVRPVAGTSDEAGSTFVPSELPEGTPVPQRDQLGNYASNAHGAEQSPANKNDWNIAQKHGALALNDLTGRIGGFNKIDPSTDYRVGAIHWTVRAGTRSQADKRDASVTIHYNSNNGSNAGCVPVEDQTVEVLQSSQLPEARVNDAGMDTALARGASDVTPPTPVLQTDGSSVSYGFVGWNTKADGSGTAVSKVSDLGSAQDLAGTVQEVYAIYAAL